METQADSLPWLSSEHRSTDDSLVYDGLLFGHSPCGTVAGSQGNTSFILLGNFYFFTIGQAPLCMTSVGTALVLGKHLCGWVMVSPESP